MAQDLEVFDSHLHVVDPRFALVPNQGFVPEPFTVGHYRERTAATNVVGGAVVAASFQGSMRPSWWYGVSRPARSSPR